MGRALRNSEQQSSKRSGGRSARIKRREDPQERIVGAPIMKIPTTEILTEESLNQIEAHSDWILKEIGIEFRGDQECLELFRQAGATVKGERVQFDSGHAKNLCSTAPCSFTMVGRNPQHSIVVGDASMSFTPGYGSPFCYR